MTRTYTDEIKAQVIAEFTAQQTPKAELARKYGIPRGTVQSWTAGLAPLAVIDSEKRHDIDALYTDFVAESLMGLRALARRSQDEDWLRTLPAKDAYLWFGTLADKVLAALAAYQSAAERNTDAVAGAGD